MKRYLEFQDSKSYKFWQIETEGKTSTVCYGKIGTTGQEKTTSFDSEEKALKEMEKLVAEKLKKGYVEKLEASSKKVSRRLSVSYDEADEGKTLLGKMEALLKSKQAEEVESLVIGCWEEPQDYSPWRTLDLLVEQQHLFPNLRELFVGDMDSEECEISWIIQADYTRVLKELTNLERLHIKGSNSLSLGSSISHENLKALTIECGGLPKEVLKAIAIAHLPNLEFLLLYIGVDEYGFDGTLDDLKPFMEKGRFPKLTYLGLADSEITDEIAAAIAEAPVLEQLETLDLSQGTLTDAGAEALLASSRIPSLKKLDLHYHYLSNEMMKRIKALGIMVDLSEQQEAEDDDYRYPAVTE